MKNTCTHCGSIKHVVMYCNSTGEGRLNRKLLKCSKCNSKTHNGDACYTNAPHYGPSPVWIAD